MTPSGVLRPDILALAGGGIVGEAWMYGVLGGIEDATGWDLRDAESFVGTSAGSIVAARLAAGRRPPRPEPSPVQDMAMPQDAGDRDGRLPGTVRDTARAAARVGWAASAPITAAALAAGAPVGALARAAVLSRAPADGRPLDDLRSRVAGWGSTFDGRLRVCAVDRGNGRRIVFGAPGAPAADVADAVCASCAIPWYFAPQRIGDRRYVDGGVWSVTNLDAAPAGRGTRVLCLDPTVGLSGGAPVRAMRAGMRVAATLELQQLRRRGAEVAHIAPDAAGVAAIGPNLMDADRVARALAAGYRQGRRLGEG